MNEREFQKLKEEFDKSDLVRKIDIYIETQGLSTMQYKELLRLYPYEEIDKLEKALA